MLLYLPLVRGCFSTPEHPHRIAAVDRGSVEAGAAEDPEAKSRLFEVQCCPEVRSKWHAARGVASRSVRTRVTSRA